jgi:hypothetical protein
MGSSISMNEKKRRSAMWLIALGLLSMLSGLTGGGHLIPPVVRIWIGVFAMGAGIIYYWQVRKG